MVSNAKSRKSRKSRSQVLHKPGGVIHPRVQAVDPQHFAILCVDCAKNRSKIMLADFGFAVSSFWLRGIKLYGFAVSSLVFGFRSTSSEAPHLIGCRKVRLREIDCSAENKKPSQTPRSNHVWRHEPRAP